MTDLAEFSQKGFNPKAWINAACASRPQDEPLERYLAELEMKLQLTAEDVDAALEANSSRILQRIPAALQEVQRVKEDVGSLQSDTQRIWEHLDSSHRKAAASVAPLAALDRVKERMEGACNTLREATELSSLFANVEEVFATGNLPRVAEVLSTMRRSLAAVGDVPEFNDGWKQLENLENRLQAMVEGPLAGALAHKKGDMVRQLVGILVAIDRYAVVERHYVAARTAPLQQFWDGFDRKAGAEAGPFVQWLPRFYDEVLLCVEGEARWCQAVLPDLHPRLLVAMLAALFEKIRKHFGRRLEANAEPEGAVQPDSLAEVMTAQVACVHFSRSLIGSVSGLTDEQSTDLVASLLQPFQTYLARYGELEAAVLSNEVAALGLDTLAEEELDTLSGHMTNAVPHVVLVVEQAVERCMKFTGGVEIGALLKAVDDNLTLFCNQLLGMLEGVRARCIPDGSGARGAKASPRNADGWDGLGDDAAKDVVPGEEAGAVIQLLGMANGLVGQLGVLEAQMHSAVAEAAALVDAHLPGGEQAALSAADVTANPNVVAVAMRLAGEPKLAAGLQLLMEQIQDQRYNSLPGCTQRASTLQQAVNALVYDSLIHKVAEQLKGVSRLPNWAEDAGPNAFNLPSFSAYPLGYVSAVGEYLMTLPQQLEAWMPAEDSDEVSHIDAEWLDKVATGAAELYTKQLLDIPKLTSKGAHQLAADLEYFCNVLSALSVSLPPALATIQVAVGLPATDFASAAADALHQPFVERKTLEAVAAMRGYSL